MAKVAPKLVLFEIFPLINDQKLYFFLFFEDTVKIVSWEGSLIGKSTTLQKKKVLFGVFPDRKLAKRIYLS